MAVPGADQVGERPFEDMVQKASQQAIVLAREQVDVARRELTARARKAGPGVAMLGGGALLAALASGTGTAALVLVLSGRRGASAAALGVTGAYAGAGAILAREGIVRLRQAGPQLPDAPLGDEPDVSSQPNLRPVKPRTKAAGRSAGTAAKSAGTAAKRTPGKAAKAAGSAAKPGRRAAGSQTGRPRRRPS